MPLDYWDRPAPRSKPTQRTDKMQKSSDTDLLELLKSAELVRDGSGHIIVIEV